MTQYRDLIAGEPLEIGDEYFVDGQWKVLTEAEYTQWVGFCSHYDPVEMSRFRRAFNKPPHAMLRTASIYAAELEKTQRMVFDDMHGGPG
jgi:hypothetical protein